MSEGYSYAPLGEVKTFSLDAPSGWTVFTSTCYAIGRLVSISVRFDTTSPTTAKIIVLENVIPSEYSVPYNMSACGFNNSSDKTLHCIISGRTINVYRPDTENLNAIKVSFMYVLP